MTLILGPRCLLALSRGDFLSLRLFMFIYHATDAASVGMGRKYRSSLQVTVNISTQVMSLSLFLSSKRAKLSVSRDKQLRYWFYGGHWCTRAVTLSGRQVTSPLTQGVEPPPLIEVWLARVVVSHPLVSGVGGKGSPHPLHPLKGWPPPYGGQPSLFFPPKWGQVSTC